jgi:4'-phosphopantetheinyl transferase
VGFPVTPGQADIWMVRLDELRPDLLPPPIADEAARAARFIDGMPRRRYLRSHGALRAVLARYTTARLDFAQAPHGKPYLPAVHELRFNLSHSHERALIGVTLGVEIGVDVERFRPMPDCLALAERFFPPSEAAAFAAVFATMPAPDRERDFFRRWTRIEAVLKARGVGLYGMGEELAGEWTIEELDTGTDAGAEYAAAVAVAQAGVRVTVRNFEGDA